MWTGCSSRRLCSCHDPHQGVGAGQCLEDAYILSFLLCHEKANADNLPVLLEIYDKMRREPAQLTSAKSEKLGDIYDLLPFKDDLDLKQVGKMIDDEFSWLGIGGALDDRQRTEDLIHKMLP